MADSDTLGNISNSRSAAQATHMQATVGQGKCPFCDENGFDPKINTVIWSGKHWRAWFNPFPYTGTVSHVIIASLEHLTNIKDLSAEAWTEWGNLNQHLILEYNLPGGGIVMRFGDNKLNGGTIHHIHSHIQVPSTEGFSIAVFFKDEPLKAFLAETQVRYEVEKSKKP